ncbi:CRISPR-associated endoribonuclease Cas6 [Brasilonema octagenarum UFV-E1]|uniref:CRISPR-associated endoribonuclease Cas6 n=1 Tax=Brasilonema sennae CENA114 TaxID=415709 RepID=A0A856M7M2_9CYAN|nr:CRISPR-associated endoribonuclease Cas6 [Brasilonema sennae]QDL07125.1 CRISPR-associated endoribonuclease Cas6 [Brasilonema sennae CENA114]QDL13489.1 CRISPR-associated endoribonuclease Cas6 [Brasilonema octagenarum UFV-E1]
MPHSLVLNLIPQSPIYPEFLTGRHYHALFLTLISSVDKDLGDYLHTSNADKPFTLSPLQIQRNHKSHQYKHNTLQFSHQRPIPPGTSCWWRISLLDDTLFSKLTPLWLNLNPEHPWHLGSADLYITSIFGTPQSTQPWANACSYTQLYEQASQGDRTLNLTLATPVAFRQGGYDTVLPNRECVFNSLLSRWNKYSGIEFSNIPIESIYPSFCNIHTEVIRNYDTKFVGCVGEISYRILGDIEPIAIKQINALADFALYAGVGRKTTMGMGMTRRLSSNVENYE